MPACRLCGIPIEFQRTAKGKLMPINVKTGKSHFGDCPVYLDQRRSGYRQSSFEDMAAPKPEHPRFPT